jgi:ankyrin repeat protein
MKNCVDRITTALLNSPNNTFGYTRKEVYTDYLERWLKSSARPIVTEQTPLDRRFEALAIAASGSRYNTKALEFLVQSLIQEGLDVDAKIKDGKTALMLAAAECHNRSGRVID